MGIGAWISEKAHDVSEWWHGKPAAPAEHHEEHPAPPPAHVENGPGGGTPQSHSDAFGHLVDGVTGAGTGQNSGQRISSHYGDNNHKPNERLGDISSPEGRDKALNMITQDGNTEDPEAKHRCAAAALIGGAIAGGGRDGLRELIAHMEEIQGPRPKNQQEDPVMKAIKAKLADPEKSKTLTVGEMQTLQDSLYHTMKFKMEGQDPATFDPDKNGGVNFKTMAKFVQGDEKLKNMFHDNHMTLDLIDTEGGKNDGNHWVLSMHDDKGALNKVYDSESRKNGQLITDKAQLDDYNNARKIQVDTEHKYG